MELAEKLICCSIIHIIFALLIFYEYKVQIKLICCSIIHIINLTLSLHFIFQESFHIFKILKIKINLII